MKTNDAVGSFKDTVAKANPQAQRLARALRKLITGIYPNVVEVPWTRQQIIGYGVGPKKRTEHFCYVAPYGTHVNLGFNFGVELPDPGHLLEGAGKKFRHVKIQELKEVKRPALRKLLQVAVKEREVALGKK
jgi:hypothetical protein